MWPGRVCGFKSSDNSGLEPKSDSEQYKPVHPSTSLHAPGAGTGEKPGVGWGEMG